MGEAKSNRFTRYFSLLLDALRSTDPAAMRPAEAAAWVRARVDVPEDDLTRLIVGGGQSIFENDIHWARFYLVKAGLISKAKRGLWALTPEGRNTRLTPEETWALYVRIRDANRPGATKDESEIPAPQTADDDGEDGRSYWFVGATWDSGDQMPRFIAEGIWENGYEDQFSDLVRRMKPGDRIAIKASFVQKHRLPFDVGGKRVSVMRIKATGTILENLDDGLKVRVAWDPPFEPRDWYFYTYRTTIVQADIESEDGRRLIDFAFRGVPQDHAWWLAQPYWVEKYGVKSEMAAVGPSFEFSTDDESDIVEIEEGPTYTLDDIIDDGCFLRREELSDILARWRLKKNLVLQARQARVRLGLQSASASRSWVRMTGRHPDPGCA
jgi:5-methylcytosine-specific restriction enzyme B